MVMLRSEITENFKDINKQIWKYLIEKIISKKISWYKALQDEIVGKI